MAELARARVRVRGIVQGVGYRFFARNAAITLGLSGYVRNLPDGGVEVVAEGDRPAVAALIEQLKIGPRYATVERLDLEWEEPTKDFQGFDYGF